MSNESRHPGEGAAASIGQSGHANSSHNQDEAQASVLHMPDREAIRQLAECLGGGLHICTIRPDGPISGQYFGDDAENAIKYAADLSKSGANVYFTVNEPKPDCGAKPTKLQIARIRAAHVDIDPPKDGSPFDKAAAFEKLRADKPTLIIDSGNGLQALWMLAEPLDATFENIAAIEAINRAIGHKHDGDASTWNVDRLLRVPGTVNRPNAKKRADGRVQCMTGVLHHD